MECSILRVEDVDCEPWTDIERNPFLPYVGKETFWRLPTFEGKVGVSKLPEKVLACQNEARSGQRDA